MNYVYYFMNYDNEIIYVGRTNNIKRRMKEHFVKGHLESSCYKEVNLVMYAVVNDSKYDTEICETLLINKYKPKYNTEKKFLERADKSTYEIKDLDFKELNFYFLENDFYITLDNLKYPCYTESINIKERCLNLINFNIGNLKHKIGLYKNLNPDIYKNHRYIYNKIIEIYNFIKSDIYYDESNLDEPISDNGDLDLSYVAFNIDLLDKMNLDARTIALLLHCGFIFRINDILYGIPLHTKNVIKTFNKKYLN